MLRVEALSKSFGALHAVRDLSFAAQGGRITSIIGPNGAGKSTVFNLITGALKSDDGTIVFLGQDITRAGQRRLRESRPTHNEVIRAHLTRRLTASQLATLGALFEALRTAEE